jgi:hypothetical protein
MTGRMDIVGNVLIKNEQRLRYFLSVLSSLSFLKDHCRLYINIEGGNVLVEPVKEYLVKLGFFDPYISSEKGYYGMIYTGLLHKTHSEYVLNLEDDHFCVLDHSDILLQMLETARSHGVHIIPATFFHVLKRIYSVASPFYQDDCCKIYHYNADMFRKLNYTQESYIVGNNCIFRRDFAMEHWGRDIKTCRPHEFEEIGYTEDYAKILLMPEFEFLRPIDDDREIPGCCCLTNPDNKKWESVYNHIDLNEFPMRRINSYLKKGKVPPLHQRIRNRIFPTS